MQMTRSDHQATVLRARPSRSHLETFFDAVPIAALVASSDRRIELVNRELLSLTGWSRAALVGRGLDELLPSTSRCVRLDGSSFPAEVRSSPVLLDAGCSRVWTIRDETSRLQTEADLFYRATHDELTGLANRSLLVDRLGHALDRLARHDGAVATLFVDLDRFKMVNDTRGHGAGDALLRAVADALVDAVRPGDTVARVGGDEFVVLCEAVTLGVARDLADRVRTATVTATRQELGAASDLVVTASVGVALDTHPSDAGLLLDAADRAMYAAKRAGGDRIAFAGE